MSTARSEGGATSDAAAGASPAADAATSDSPAGESPVAGAGAGAGAGGDSTHAEGASTGGAGCYSRADAPEDEPPVFMAKHADYVVRVGAETDTMLYAVTEHLRMSGVYWGLCAMEIMSSGDKMDKPAIAKWVMTCYHPDTGGFGGNTGHDPHMLYTLSAVQLMALCDRLEEVDADKYAGVCCACMGYFCYGHGWC